MAFIWNGEGISLPRAPTLIYWNSPFNFGQFTRRDSGYSTGPPTPMTPSPTDSIMYERPPANERPRPEISPPWTRLLMPPPNRLLRGNPPLRINTNF